MSKKTSNHRMIRSGGFKTAMIALWLACWLAGSGRSAARNEILDLELGRKRDNEPALAAEEPIRMQKKEAKRAEFESSAAWARVNKVSLQDGEYVVLDLPGGGTGGEVGEPQLPFYGKFVAVPEGATVRLVVDDVKWKEAQGRYIVAPRQSPPLDKAGAPPPPFSKNADSYRRDEFQPALPVRISDQMRVRGQALVYIHYTPIAFNPGRSALRVANKVKWHLEFDFPANQVEAQPARHEGLEAEAFAPFFDNVVDTRVKAESPPVKPPADLAAGNGADYLIITHDNFHANILPLAAWKHAKGYKTRVVKLSEISPTPTAANITAYITAAYAGWSPRPTYVLLVGDSAYLPAWYKTLHSYYGSGVYSASDLWYATVDGTDYFPDLFLGRLPCASAAECDLMVNKILNVEKTPDATAAMYRTVLTSGEFTDAGSGYEERIFIETAEAVRDYHVTRGHTAPTSYCTDTATTPRYYNSTRSLVHPNGSLYGGAQTYLTTTAGSAAITNSINSGSWLVQHRDHGSRTGGWATPPFNPLRASQLTNGNKLPVVMSINCETAWFDGTSDSLAEAFLKNPNGGSHGVIGATRVSYSWYNDWFTHGLYECMYPDYFETLSGISHYKTGLTYGSNYAGHGTHLGQMLNFAKILMYEKQGSGTTSQIEFDILTLLGDPEGSPRNAVPGALAATHPAELLANVPAGFSVGVTSGGAPLAGALVALVLDPTEYHVATTSADGTAAFNFTPTTSGTMSVTVSHQNGIPYQGGIVINAKAVSVTMPSVAMEGAGVLTGQGHVSVSPPPQEDIVVTLVSSDHTEVTVPDTITVSSGQSTVPFDVTILDDAIIDGSQTATVTPSAAAYASASALISVTDNETNVLTVGLPASTGEQAGTVQGSVTASFPPESDVVVNLNSSDSTEVTVPPGVTIPAGQMVVSFPMTIVNDTLIDGTQEAAVTAHVENWTDGSANISVVDNENTNLALAPPSSVSEASSATVTVSISGTLPNGLVIALSSGNPARLTVPASVTIAAGGTSAAFTAAATDNALTDGTQAVTITASASDFTAAGGATNVLDNDVHHFHVSSIGTSQLAGEPFSVTLTAKDINDVTIGSYTGTPGLSAGGTGGVVTITPTVTPAFAGGVWSGNVTAATIDNNVVLTVADGAGHTGASNAFNVATGLLHHFAWSAVTNPQSINTPLGATITAKDIVNNTVTGFSGTVSLNCGTPSTRNIGSGTTSSTTLPLHTYYEDQRTQSIYLQSEIGAAGPIRALALNVTTLPGQTLSNWTIRMKHTSLASYTTAAWESTGWTTVYQANRTITATGLATFTFPAPFDYNGTSNLMVDFSFNNSTYTSDGAVVCTTASAPRTIYYYTDSQQGDPLTWSGTSPAPTTTAVVPNLALQMDGTVPINPDLSDSFVNGTWTGPITVRQAATGAVLRADDGSGHTGYSASFDVISAGNLTLVLPVSASEGNAPVIATLGVSAPAAADLTVNLVSSDTTQATVPATVTIPSGQAAVEVPLTIIDDAWLDGTREVTINATRAGYGDASATISVNDNETAILAVSAPATTTEGVGTLQGTVTMNTAPDTAVAVTLSSSNQGFVRTPSTVTIPGGQTSASFTLTIIDDNMINGTHGATITAHVANWTDGTAAISISDNENTNLVLNLPVQVVDGSTGSGTVAISGTLASPLDVSLHSGTPTRLAVPASVTIPAGSTSAAFAMTAPDNTVVEGTQSVAITAGTPGFTGAAGATSVMDNTAHHFTFSTITSPKSKGAPFTVTITAKDAANATVTTYTGTPSLTASGEAGTANVSRAGAGAFSGGVWTGSVTVNTADTNIALTATDSVGRTGASNLFNVTVATDYFTELFDSSGTNDVSNQSFLFTPDGSAGYYAVQRTPGTAFYTNPVGGTSLTMSDDTSVQVTAAGGASVRLYGTSYTSLYVGSNGYITFGAGDTTYSESLANHFSKPRVSALMDDLLPTTGQVTWKQTTDRVAVTWQGVRENSASNSNSFQIEMYFDGRIRITCLGIAATDGLIGLSQGLGTPSGFIESNFSGYSSQTLGVITPALATEGDAPVSGTITLTPTPTADVVVNLASNPITEATVPATLTVPAGQASATFEITVIDDAVLDGLQNATISATATGFPGGAGIIGVQDNESAILSVTAPATTIEGAGTVQGSVTVSAAPASPVTVNLTSSDTTEATVPATIIIAAGQTSASFGITVVNDNQIDGTQNATITAHVANWTDGSAVVAVQDNETYNLALSPPVSVSENGTGTGTVSLSGSLPSAVTVSLASDPSSRLSVPATVTIPAGSASATFTLTAPDNILTDGTQLVTITATASGFTGISATTNVLDNDVHHFAVSAVASPQVRGAPFSVTFAAKDINDLTIATYTGVPGISASGNGGIISVTPGVTTPFVSGLWTGNVTVHAFDSNAVLTVDDGAGHLGTSNPFSLGTGPLHHLTWSNVTGPQTANIAFGTTLTAQDAGNNTLTDFNGAANLSGFTGSGPDPTIVITEINPNTPDEIEFANVSPAPVNISGWTVHIYHNVGYPVPLAAFTIPAGTTCSAGQVFRLRESGTAPGTFPQFYCGANIDWTATTTARVAVMLRDSEGDIVDFVGVGAGLPASITSPVAVPASQWNGATVTPTTTSTLDYARTGGSDGNSATDWTIATIGMGTINPGLILPFPPATVAVPITPAASAGFVNGVWTGDVVISTTAIQMKLRADDGSGHTGISNAFDVYGSLTLGLPPDIREGDAPATATLSVTPAVTGNLTVNLASSDTSELTVPLSVTIPAGGSSVTFPVNIVDDVLLDGPQPAAITASAAAHHDGQAAVSVNDNESATLAVMAPDTVTEGAGTVLGTITVSEAPASDFTVSLSSSDTTALVVPANLVIGSGETSVNFPITVVDDAKVDGTQNATISAHVTNWTDGTAFIAVEDDEDSILALTLPTSVREGETVSGTVTIAIPPAEDLTIHLNPDIPSHLAAPSTVIIPARFASASFTLTAPDNAYTEGTRPVTITASANGTSSTHFTTNVLDDDVHHYLVAAIASPQTAGTPFSVTLTAKDADDLTIADYTGIPAISANGDGGVVDIKPMVVTGFVSGIWTGSVTVNTADTGVVLTVDDGQGHTGASNSFNVAAGAMHHLTWSHVAGPLNANTGFSATITARDAANNTVTDFNGTVALDCGIPSRDIGSGTSSNSTLPLHTFYHDQRSQCIYLQSEIGGAAALRALSLNITTPPGQTMNHWTIRMKHTPMTDYSTPAWEGTGWTTVYQSDQTISATGLVTFNFTTPFIYDGVNNLMVDFSFNNSSYSGSGAVLCTTTSPARSIYRFTDSGYGDPLAWTGTSNPQPLVTAALPDLQLQMDRTVPISPTTAVGFADGVWTGTITVQQSATAVNLRADDGAGHVGESNSFNVISPPVATTLPASMITATSAILNGTVSANGSSATVSFDYGMSELHGITIPGNPSQATGNDPTAVNSLLTGLIPATTYHFRASGTNIDGTSNGANMTFTTAPNNNAALTRFSLGAVTLSPAFATGITNYTAVVASTTSTITVTPTATDANATIKVNGLPVVSGHASPPIDLTTGGNLITTIVTAQDGVTERAYTVIITRRTAYQDWIAGGRHLIFGGPDGSGGFSYFAAYARRKDLAGSFHPEFSTDMANWIESTVEPMIIAEEGDHEIVTIPFPSPATTPRAFFRLRVTNE